MSRCTRCKVKIIDDTDRCPLCQQVLEDDGIPGESRYPNASDVTRKYIFFENLILFLSLIASFLVVLGDLFFTGHMDWSLVVLFLIFYGNVVLRLAIVGRSGYKFKILCLVIVTIVVLFMIDYFTGYKGWALDYVLPSGIIAVDIGVLILMIVNRRNWQSYMMLQLFMIVLSAIVSVLVFLEVIKFPYLALGAFAFSLFIFLGTLILGDQRARTELERRFYI